MEWLLESKDIMWHAALTTTVLIVVITIYVRINGLRSFAKMSSIDFVTTITIGSVINSTIMSDTNSIGKGALVVGLLILIQSIFSRLKLHTNWFSRISENEPVMLMKDGEFLTDNLKKTNVTRSDVIAKLREANALQLKQVYAVILETTGDISVLRGENSTGPDSILYDDVKV